MRTVQTLAVALATVATFAGTVADARHHYYRNGNARQRYEDCRADKRRSGHQGIAVGALAGGAGGALLGGGVGGALAGAAAGGVAGNYLGRGSPHRCSEGR